MHNSDDNGTAGAKRRYDVGYKRPPRHSRFKPGQSGNPKGRRKKQRSESRIDLLQVLNQPVLIREGERTRYITKGEACLQSLVNRAATGDAKASTTLLSLLLQLRIIQIPNENEDHADARSLIEEDGRLLDDYFAHRRPDAGSNDGS